jgi:hypothetical protein
MPHRINADTDRAFQVCPQQLMIDWSSHGFATTAWQVMSVGCHVATEQV